MSSEISVLQVALGERAYEIHIGAGLLGQGGEILGRVLRQPRAIVVTDQNLERTRHPKHLMETLTRAGVDAHMLVVPAGEASKSMSQLERLLEDMLALNVERKVTVVALGGGVVGDLAGFAAAVLLRGVDFVQVPTTLLAQVDSSVGGKTGINSRHGKNLIGAFHQPRLVLVDTDVLDDLPPRELRAGYAELVKHAFIRDPALFDWLEEQRARLFAGDSDVRREAIHRSLAIKAAIVAEDERETTGTRALLNFGHTFAHAYEALAGYGEGLLHGEAVALGMTRAFELSVRLGLCPAAEAERARTHLDAVGLAVRSREVRNAIFPAEGLLEAMQRDKKVEAKRLTFVLSHGIGKAALHRDVPEADLRAVLDADA
jgi:3-dehydroquinate synthase